jgi:cysteine-rich repeat protein
VSADLPCTHEVSQSGADVTIASCNPTLGYRGCVNGDGTIDAQNILNQAEPGCFVFSTATLTVEADAANPVDNPATIDYDVVYSGDGCGATSCGAVLTSQWTRFVCGDGDVTTTCEQCDEGDMNSDTAPDRCRTNCQNARCGDGVIDTGEECDDANEVVGDGCESCLIPNQPPTPTPTDE